MTVDKFARFIVGTLAEGLYDFRVEGREHIPSRGPAIIVANHRSYIDPFVLGYPIEPAPRYVATVRVFRNAYTRWFCQQMAAIPTRRGGADPRAVREVLRALHAGSVVGIFPEGERSWDGASLPLMEGVVKLLQRARVPVIPASLVGTYEAWPRWAPQPRLAPLRVVFGAPLPAWELDRDELTRVIESAIHGPVRSAGLLKVRGVGLARGLPRLLWWCPACGTVGGLRERVEDLECRSCGAIYYLDRRYRLRGPAPEPGHPLVSRSLHEWMRTGPPPRRPLAPLPGESDWLERGEEVHLRSEATLMLGRHPQVKRLGVGVAVLTDRRLRFQRPGFATGLSLRAVTTLVIEGPEVLQVGGPERMWRLWLPDDSALKWQTCLEGLRAAERGDAQVHAT